MDIPTTMRGIIKIKETVIDNPIVEVALSVACVSLICIAGYKSIKEKKSLKECIMGEEK